MKLLITADEGDPRNVSYWSGTPFYISKALSTKFELCYEGGLKTTLDWKDKAIRRWHLTMKTGWYEPMYEYSTAKKYAEKLKEAIRREKPDAVVAIRAAALGALDVDIPTYFIHDATWAQLVNYYSQFTGLCQSNKDGSEKIQAEALRLCTGAIYSSSWASESAIKDYGTPEAKVHTIALGPNLEAPPAREEVLASIDKRFATPVVRFLFAGVEWERKGGPQVIRVLRELVARGVNVHLDIAGVTPPPDVVAEPFVTAHGFLSKKKPEQYAKFRGLFADATFFFMPSEMECCACAFCESVSYGLPVIARATGGVAEVVKEGMNGFLYDATRPEEEFIETIYTLCKDPARSRQLSLQARDDYEGRLTWEKFASKVEKVIRSA